MISLVMATVGRSDEIRRLIDTLARQGGAQFELIAVDQNPDDRLVPILAEAGERGLSVRHLRLDRPNLSQARNLGIAAARHDIIGFPDDDCWYAPDCLAEIHRTFSAADAPDAAIALWEERDPQCAGLPPHDLLWPSVSHFRSVPISSITLFVRRDSIEQAGGFDGRLGIGRWFGSGEETDLIMSLVRRGRRVRFVPTARVHHAVGDPARKPAGHWQALRRRARGTGAIYAKHALPLQVVLRGLFSPLGKAILGHPPGPGDSCALILGRLEGYLKWHRNRTDRQ